MALNMEVEMKRIWSKLTRNKAAKAGEGKDGPPSRTAANGGFAAAETGLISGYEGAKVMR